MTKAYCPICKRTRDQVHTGNGHVRWVLREMEADKVEGALAYIRTLTEVLHSERRPAKHGEVVDLLIISHEVPDFEREGFEMKDVPEPPGQPAQAVGRAMLEEKQ